MLIKFRFQSFPRYEHKSNFHKYFEFSQIIFADQLKVERGYILYSFQYCHLRAQPQKIANIYISKIYLDAYILPILIVT